MDDVVHEERISAAPQGRELIGFLFATVMLTLITLAFIELLIVLTITVLVAMIMAFALAALEDRITGKVARFSLAVVIMCVLIAAFAGLLAGTASSLYADTDTPGTEIAGPLLTALLLGGIPALMAGTGVGAYFANVRGAGGSRLRWVAAEASVYAVLLYMVSVVVIGFINGLF